MHDVDLSDGDGKRYQSLTRKLAGQLQQLVFEIDRNDSQKQNQLLEIKPSLSARIFLFIPAILGFLVHAPLYLPLKSFTYKRTWNNDHFDSVLVTLLLFLYPVYVILLTAGITLLTHNSYFLFLILVLPALAWAYVQLKPQLDKPGTTSQSS